MKFLDWSISLTSLSARTTRSDIMYFVTPFILLNVHDIIITVRLTGNIFILYTLGIQ